MTADDAKDALSPTPAPPAELEGFIGAAGRGDLNAMASFLGKYPAAIDWQNDRGDTALIAAAAKGHEKAVALLLEKGADTGRKNRNGWTALAYAAWHRFPDIATLLLDGGANIEAKDNVGWTPLMRAVIQKRPDIAALLLERGAQIDAKSTRGLTPLMLSALNGDRQTAAFLLEKGASCEETDIEGKTAAMLAKEKNHPATAQLIGDWVEHRRWKREREQNAELEAKAQEIAAAQIGKLKNRRPPKNPFKEGKPGP